MSSFQRAQKKRVPVKIGLAGPSGSGKTYTALRMAEGIAGDDGKIAVIDTEHGSALEYADEFEFDHAEIVGDYRPANFVEKMKEAEREGYDVIVVDGISPAWNGPGGVQEIVDKNTKGGNSWSGWAVGTPEHQKLLEGILACRTNLICTMRSKTAWALQTNDRGKQEPVKIGLEPVQRDGIDYEFTVVGHLDLAHNLTIVKSRRRAVPVGVVINEPGENVGKRLVEMAQERLPDEPPQPEPQEPMPPAQPAPGTTPQAPPEEPPKDMSEPGWANTAAENGTEEAEKIPGTALTIEQINQLDQLTTELATFVPQDWNQKVTSAIKRDFDAENLMELTSTQCDQIIERLKTTLADQKAKAAGTPA